MFEFIFKYLDVQPSGSNRAIIMGQLLILGFLVLQQLVKLCSYFIKKWHERKIERERKQEATIDELIKKVDKTVEELARISGAFQMIVPHLPDLGKMKGDLNEYYRRLKHVESKVPGGATEGVGDTEVPAPA